MLVVDNGGTLTDQALAAWPLRERTRLISRPDNPGYGAAVNEAMNGTHDAVLVLTHDAMFDPRLAEHLLESLAAASNRGAAAPVLHFADQPDRVFSAGGALTRGGRAWHRTDLAHKVSREVDWVDGAIVMYRRSALDAIGWLAEDYFLYFEDVDTAWRMRRAGFSTVIVPDAVAFQQPGAHPVYLGIRNMTMFARRAGIPTLAHVGAVSRRIVEESIVRMRRGRSPELRAALRGWRDGRRGRSGKPTT